MSVYFTKQTEKPAVRIRMICARLQAFYLSIFNRTIPSTSHKTCANPQLQSLHVDLERHRAVIRTVHVSQDLSLLQSVVQDF